MLRVEEIKRHIFQIDKHLFPSRKMLAAVAVIGKTSWFGNNNRKSHPRMVRKFENGQENSCCHAEVDALSKVPKRCRHMVELYVVRFLKDGSMTMAKPCNMCQNFLKENMVKFVYYTNWDGEWDQMRLN